MKNIETNKKQIDKYTIILILIMLIGIITRIIGLGKIPIGINVDEAGTMYDAYTIANYGTDRFGNTYPVYMINYGGGQSALYTYLASIFIKLFGFIDSIKNVKKDFKGKNISLDIVMLANFLSVCICNILVEAGINRINAIYISLIYYTALGIMYVSDNREKLFKFIIIIYIMYYITFLAYYFGIYGKKNTNLSFNNNAVEVVKYIEENEKFDGKKINFRLYAIQPYIYTLIETKISPQEFMNTVVIEDNSVLAYNRYIFYNTEIKDDTIYVIQNDENAKNILMNNGFKVEEYNEKIYIV